MNSNFNLGSRFDEIVKLYPKSSALYYPDENQLYTYKELDLYVTKSCNFFKKQKLKNNSIIAIFNDKSIYGYSIILACLKLGFPYVNLDESSPFIRLEKIINLVKPNLIINLFQNDSIEKLFIETFQNIFIERDKFIKIIDKVNLEKLNSKVISSNPAYIMFTSGSTGFPKGVTISHGNVLNFIEWCRNVFQISHNDKLTNINPPYFDNSVFDFFNSFFNGACLIPFRKEQIVEPLIFINLMEKAECTIYFSVPSLLIYLLAMRVLTSQSLGSLKKIIFGGEGFPKNKLKTLFQLFDGRAELFNVYGPTECTCMCSAHKVEKQDFESMLGFTTLGKLAPMFNCEILNIENGIGELFLLGDNVGLGYFNNVRQTKEVFVQNPMHSNYIDIGYKTGDLVKIDKHANLFFVGRKDDQIKYLGYRIELGEIEAAANLIKEINEAVAVFKKTSFSDGQIILYLSLREEIKSKDIRNQLNKNLPRYMMPKKIIKLNFLPKNTNGKIDRKQLKNFK